MTDTKMVHLRVDLEYYTMDRPPLEARQMACGMRQLADGHQWIEDTRAACLHVTCPICLPECEQLGTPISQLSGRPGRDGYAAFVRIANSWGYP